jgi:hypothetical protein
MTRDPASTLPCLRRDDGSIDTGFYLDRAHVARNAALAERLRALLARVQRSGRRKAAARSSAASASGSLPW